MTPTQRLVLAMAVVDGGAVELSGIDARKWMNKSHDTAARDLHCHGYGRYDGPAPWAGARFTINENGKDALA